MKRVYCLYRVSTKKQVDKNENDIPMQKNACHDFVIRQNDWSILKEFSEKGVSGYKVSAQNRDAIQELKDAAVKNEFDVLLVFMFDRIGRIDDETPFVVEWFVKLSGLVNKKGQPIKKLEIDPAEEAVIHLIDDMTVHNGYGSWRMAQYLNEHGYKTHTGKGFTSMKIIRILRDSYYCGILPDGRTSEALQKLRIRSDDMAKQIGFILDQRNMKNEEKRHVARNTKGKALLSGNVFCAHCGSRLVTIRYTDRYIRADGSEYSVEQAKYACYHKSRKLCECDGQTTYQADQIDKIITQIIRKLFSCMTGAPEEEKLQLLFKQQIARNRAEQKKATLEISKSKDQLAKLQMEIGKSLTGDSVYSPEDLSQAITVLKEKISAVENKLVKLQDEEENKKSSVDLITSAYNQFKSWADEFDTATLEQKKMIACQLFKRVEVGRDYKVSVELNMTYKQFCNEWGNEASIYMAV